MALTKNGDGPDKRAAGNNLDLSFDQYQRYRIIEEIIDAMRDGPCMKILDVGGYPGYLRLFLPDDDILLVDLADDKIPNYLKADALALPFGDGSFDIAVTADTLEHITKEDRPKFLSEVSRVVRKAVVLAAPFCTEDVEAYEQLANSFHRGACGEDFFWLKEHIDNGLPDLEETTKALGNAFPHVSVYSNGYLPRWIKMMTASVGFDGSYPVQHYSDALHRFYNETFYEYDNKPPSYRKVIVASKGAAGKEIPAKAEDDSSRRNEETLDWLIQHFQDIYLKAVLHYRDKEMKLKDGVVRQREEKIRYLETRIRDMQNSNSWRVTAPLRGLTALFRKK